jgi:hypothetical protein
MSSTTEFPVSTSMPQFSVAQENQDAKLEEVGQLGMSQEGASPAALPSTCYYYRSNWGLKNGQNILTLNWGIITPKSLVFVAIGEGVPPGPNNGKKIGQARYTLHNVAPGNGVISILVTIDWPNPIPLYVDYFVINP